MIDVWFKYYSLPAGNCTRGTTAQHVTATLTDTQVVFYGLGLGLSLASLTLFLEWIVDVLWHSKKRESVTLTCLRNENNFDNISKMHSRDIQRKESRVTRKESRTSTRM